MPLPQLDALQESTVQRQKNGPGARGGTPRGKNGKREKDIDKDNTDTLFNMQRETKSSARGELNARPFELQSNALPLSYEHARFGNLSLAVALRRLLSNYFDFSDFALQMGFPFLFSCAFLLSGV
jgi:hypothetical protein